MKKQSKREAGRRGGLATVQKHGKAHMQAIGRKGAAETWRRYDIVPVGTSGYALVRKCDNQVIATW